MVATIRWNAQRWTTSQVLTPNSEHGLRRTLTKKVGNRLKNRRIRKTYSQKK